MLVSALTLLIFLVSIPFAVVTAVVVLQIAASLRSRESLRKSASRDIRSAIVIPAHNEAAGIAATLRSVTAQLRENDRLVVVADNCTDDTAAIAAAEGATVIERFDDVNIGKGFALDAAIGFLKANDPVDVVIFVDADCRLETNCIRLLRYMAVRHGRPVQSCYLLTAGAKSSKVQRIREFAFLVRNYVRPLGGARLGFPSPLTGAGMAFPWHVVERIEFATGHLTEDLKIGIESALAGFPPVFCPDARVLSDFPTSEAGALKQKSRWESGHLSLIREYFTKLVKASLSRGDLRLFAEALDLSVPPLVFLIASDALLFLLACAALPFGYGGALLLPLLLLPALTVALTACWWTHGREIISLGDVLSMPSFVFRRLARVTTSADYRNAQWVRTERDGERHGE